MDRRLAAIVAAADVVGYGVLVGRDEEGTIDALRHVRAQIVDPAIAAHNGRIVKLMGDGLLAEFASAADAVRTAHAVQTAMPDWNADRPEDARIVFRVGVNPCSLFGLSAKGTILAYSGPEHYEAATKTLQEVIRLGPRDIGLHWYHAHMAAGSIVAGNDAEAVEQARTAIRLESGNGTAHRHLAAGLARPGDLEQA